MHRMYLLFVKFMYRRHSLALILLVSCFLYVFSVGILYKKAHTELLVIGGAIFQETISVDMDERLKETKMPVLFRIEPNDTASQITIKREGHPTVYKEKTDSYKQQTYAKKQNNTTQSVLMIKNPIRVNALDSLYSGKLQDADIKAETAVRYTDNVKGETTYSCVDTLFFKNSDASPPETIGFEDEITLQAFIKFSPVSIVGHALFPMSGITAVWLLLMVMLFYFLLRKEKQGEMIPATYPDTYKYQLADHLVYDAEKGIILYNSDEILLTPQAAQVLDNLLRSPDHFMTYSQLIRELYGDADIGGKNRLDQTIKRTREILAEIPELRIMNVSKKGYRLMTPTGEEQVCGDEEDQVL